MLTEPGQLLNYYFHPLNLEEVILYNNNNLKQFLIIYHHFHLITICNITSM